MSTTLKQSKLSARELDPSKQTHDSSDSLQARKVKVCFLIDNLSLAGTENHLLRLIESLDKNRFEPVLVLLDGSLESSRKLEPDCCQVKRLGIQSFLRPSIALKTISFSHWLRSQKIDILQMYFPDSSLFGAVAGKLAGIKNVIRTRRNSGHWITNLHRIRGRLISRLVHATLVNSPASGESVIEQERATPDSVTMIPNGIELSRFENHAQLRWNKSQSDLMDHYDQKQIRIGMLANLRSVKRIDVFIESAKRLIGSNPNLMFDIAGDGELRGEFESFIRANGLSQNVKLHGAIQDVPEFLKRLDVFVSCSEAEGLSNSTLEAMASGLPIIATDIPGNHLLIKQRVTGLLTSVGDHERLANQILMLVESPLLSKQLGTEAHRYVAENFEQNQMVAKYESIFLQMGLDQQTEVASSGSIER
jgi:glycosyltransferase involved in cell wall biosynthesis